MGIYQVLLSFVGSALRASRKKTGSLVSFLVQSEEPSDDSDKVYCLVKAISTIFFPKAW